MRKRPNKVHGWLVVNKGSGMSSTQAVGKARRLLEAGKAGHAGALDPMAQGVLPIALGDATKTVPFVMDADKEYVFTIRWGLRTDSHDMDGAVIETNDARPSREAIEAELAGFTGVIWQRPPKVSAVKVAGKRAYDLARNGVDVALAEREVKVHWIKVLAHGEHGEHGEAGKAWETIIHLASGKGFYVRAFARDLAKKVGGLATVAALRRERVGKFTLAQGVHLEQEAEEVKAALLPIDWALEGLSVVGVNSMEAARLRCGQGVVLRAGEVREEGEALVAQEKGVSVALVRWRRGILRPVRVFHGMV